MKRKCKECSRTKGAHLFSYRKWTCNKCYKESEAYAKQRDQYLQSTYGITLKEYQRLLEAQGGGCAICGGLSGGKNLAVDHNHKSGNVRGLLCKRHNSAIARWIRNADEAYEAYIHFKHGAARTATALGREVKVPEETK